MIGIFNLHVNLACMQGLNSSILDISKILTISLINEFNQVKDTVHNVIQYIKHEWPDWVVHS